jgi:hypothetical protein
MARTGIKLEHLYKTAALAVLLFCYSHAAIWDTQIVEPRTGDVSQANIDMKLDINGVAHIVYFDDETYGGLSLVCATNEEGSWIGVSVEQENFTFSALKAVIAIDANNTVYIVYPDSDLNLVYKKKEGGQWYGGTIDYNKSLPYGAVVNGQGGLYVLYSSKVAEANSNDTTLILKTPAGSEVIAEHGNFQSGSLAIDSMSNPHLCYYDALNNILNYAVKAGSSWTIETVDANIGDVDSAVWGSASLALDGNDIPHISYIDFTPPPVLKYADKLSGGWVPQVVDDTEYIDKQSSIAVDSHDSVHICYKRIVNKRVFLKHAVGTAAGEWQFTDTVTDFNKVDTTYLDIICSENDKPNICYTVPVLQTVEYAVPFVCVDPNHPGDADKNCKVDFFDFSILAQYWYKKDCALDDYCSGADLNTNGDVDINDLNLLANDWLYCSLPDCY